MPRTPYLKALEALIRVKNGVSGTRVRTGNCFRVQKAILKNSQIMAGPSGRLMFPS
jgi:hypothetical protein